MKQRTSAHAFNIYRNPGKWKMKINILKFQCEASTQYPHQNLDKTSHSSKPMVQICDHHKFAYRTTNKLEKNDRKVKIFWSLFIVFFRKFSQLTYALVSSLLLLLVDGVVVFRGPVRMLHTVLFAFLLRHVVISATNSLLIEIRTSAFLFKIYFSKKKSKFRSRIHWTVPTSVAPPCRGHAIVFPAPCWVQLIVSPCSPVLPSTLVDSPSWTTWTRSAAF